MYLLLLHIWHCTFARLRDGVLLYAYMSYSVAVAADYLRILPVLSRTEGRQVRLTSVNAAADDDVSDFVCVVSTNYVKFLNISLLCYFMLQLCT